MKTKQDSSIPARFSPHLTLQNYLSVDLSENNFGINQFLFLSNLWNKRIKIPVLRLTDKIPLSCLK